MRKYDKQNAAGKFLQTALLALSLLALTGCFDMHEADDFAYVIALGVDQADAGQCSYTFQYARPMNFAGTGRDKNSDKESSASGSSTEMTVTAPSLLEAIDETEKTLSRKTTFMHLRLMVCAESLARQGLNEELIQFMHNITLSPNTILAVAAETAQHYLRSVRPPMEANPLKHYDLLFREMFGSDLSAVTVRQFCYGAALESHSALAAYVGLSGDENTDATALPLPTEADLNQKNGETRAESQQSDLEAKVIGTALFKDTQMVGSIGVAETKLYRILNGTFSEGVFTMPSPSDPALKVSMRLAQNKAPRYAPSVAGGVPRLDIHLYLTPMASNASQIRSPKLSTNEAETASSALAQSAEKLLVKTAAQYHTDILRFGMKFRHFFHTWEEWTDYGWDEKYPQSEFKVYVKMAD